MTSNRQPAGQPQGSSEMAQLIGALDWSKTPLGAMGSWPEALRTAVDIMLASPLPTSVLWGPERIQLYNDAYIPMAAHRHPAALGRPAAQTWAEAWDALLAPILERVAAGEAVRVGEDQVRRFLRLDGQDWEERRFMATFSAIRDRTGAVAGAFHTLVEITAQPRPEGGRLQAEADLRQVLEQGLGGRRPLTQAQWETDAQGVVTSDSPSWRTLTGQTREDWLAGGWTAAVHPEDREGAERTWREAIASGRALDHEYRLRTASGDWRWSNARAVPLRDAAGRILKWVGLNIDVHDRKQAEAALRESEARFRLMADAVPQIVWITDPDGRTEFFNRQWTDYTGAPYEPGTAAQVATSFVHPDDGAATMAAFDEARRTGNSFLVEHRIRSKAGDYRWFLVRGEPHRDPQSGRITRWFGASVDIHDRRQAEAVLRDSEARLRFLTELDETLRSSVSARDAMLAATRLLAQHLGASRCAYADVDDDNDRFVIRSDYSAPGLESSVGTYSLDLFGSRAASNMRGGQTLIVRDVPRELAPDDGREMFLSIGISAIICCPLVRSGRLVAMMAMHQVGPRDWRDDEITLVETVVARCWAHVERVGAEARLRESEAKFQAIANSIDQMVWSTRPDGFHDYYNQRWYDYTGVPSGSTDGEGWNGVFHPDDQKAAWALWRRSLETGEPYHIEYRLRHRSGQYRWVLGRAQPVRDALGRITRWFGTCTDIQEIVEAREVLTRSRTELEQLVAQRTAERDRMWEISPDLMLVIDFHGVFRRVNPAWTAILGYSAEKLVDHHVNEFVVPDDHQGTVAAYELAAQGGQPRIVNRYRHKDGSLRWISWTAAPAGDLTYATGRDMTAEIARQAELEAAQEQLRQSQKMEAMGQLTGGVAHDFNNLLTPIIASLDMLLRRGVGSERERRLMDGALQSAERAKVLVQRLLAFARRQPLQPGPVDLGRLVDGMAELIASTSGPQVEVQVDLPPDLPPALADVNQLEMALLNLAVNARDAMPEGGVLTISAAQVSVRDPRHAAKLRPGHYVHLSVKDTGSGMDEATLARAVEPFFSTKGIGKGTGLGLSMVHGLTSQLGGGLTIASRLGEGTTVELWLPISPVAVKEAAGPSESLEVAGAHGTALLVDDEDLVRMSTADMLMDLGYEVVEARSAEEALRRVEEGLAPDLVVTDHLMPGLSGLDLARDLRARRPDLPLLIVSGYAEMDGVAPGFPRLTKPFRAAELAASLASLRSGGPA